MILNIITKNIDNSHRFLASGRMYRTGTEKESELEVENHLNFPTFAHSRVE